MNETEQTLTVADPRQAEIDELRCRLEEAESTLAAIRSGEVDAIVVSGAESPRIYTLEGADHPYRVFVEAMQQGAVTVATDGTVVFCNASFMEMVKRPLEKIIGAKVHDFFSSADRAQLQKALSDDPIDRRPEEFTLLAEGTDLPVLVSANCLPIDLPVLCLVITDLTEHRQNLHLKDSDRRKNEFLAMLAHELRNPLAPIVNAVEVLLLLNTSGNGETVAACEIVERQVRQMVRLIDDLLDVSRITRGKINLKTEPADLLAIAATALETSRPLIEARRQELHVSITSEPLQIEADVTRLAQVMTNLLNNAAKYTEEQGQIWLTIEQEPNEAVIRVRDDGIGIAPDVLPTVFDLFIQGERGIDRSQGGLGIGLTLVRSLVEMHGGTVSAASAGAGKGSEFVVRLPLSRKTAPSACPAPSRHFSPAESRRSRVLVVDDNRDCAAILAMLLQAKGHEPFIAADGRSAIAMARSLRPALVLLDIGLPGMDGYAVAEQLRKLPETCATKLIAITGYGDDQDRLRSKQAGFDHHLVKPVSAEVLEGLLQSVVAEPPMK
jgi:two-component system CheB/CheR fusion protein